MNLTLTDTTATGDIIRKISIDIENERTTLRDIIIARVTYEVKKHNRSDQKSFFGLVQPTESEQHLNGYRLFKKKKIDLDEQLNAALSTFDKNGFFVLIDDRQVDNLDDEVLVDESTHVQFIKLSPLVGG